VEVLRRPRYRGESHYLVQFTGWRLTYYNFDADFKAQSQDEQGHLRLLQGCKVDAVAASGPQGAWTPG
jgi:hypothetical protein